MVINFFKYIFSVLDAIHGFSLTGQCFIVFFFLSIFLVVYLFNFDNGRYNSFLKYGSIFYFKRKSKVECFILSLLFFLFWWPIFLINHSGKIGPRVFGSFFSLILFSDDFAVSGCSKILTAFYIFYMSVGLLFATVYESNAIFRSFVIKRLHFGCDQNLDAAFHFFFNSNNMNKHIKGQVISGVIVAGIVGTCSVYGKPLANYANFKCNESMLADLDSRLKKAGGTGLSPRE